MLCKEPIAVHCANHKNRLAITNSVRNSVLLLNLEIYKYGGVSKKASAAFRSGFRTTKQRKYFISVYFHKHLVLEIRAQQCVDHRLLDFFYLWGHLETLVYAASTENEETLHHVTSFACQTMHICSLIFETVRNS